MVRGHSHEIEPDDDSVSFIDFESDEYRGLAQDRDRENWHVEMAQAALGAAGITVAETDLHMEYQLREEELFWSWVENEVNDAGFDTYNSDSRFEVFGKRREFEVSCRSIEVRTATVVARDETHARRLVEAQLGIIDWDDADEDLEEVIDWNITEPLDVIAQWIEAVRQLG